MILPQRRRGRASGSPGREVAERSHRKRQASRMEFNGREKVQLSDDYLYPSEWSILFSQLSGDVFLLCEIESTSA